MVADKHVQLQNDYQLLVLFINYVTCVLCIPMCYMTILITSRSTVEYLCNFILCLMFCILCQICLLVQISVLFTLLQNLP